MLSLSQQLQASIHTGQTVSYLDIEIIVNIEQEKDVSVVIIGAQSAFFVANQLYLTPKIDQMVQNLNNNLPQGLDPFSLNQQEHLTQKDFSNFELSQDVQIKENDLLYLRENHLYFGARPVDES